MEVMKQDFESRGEQMKTRYEAEVTRVKQQNYALTAKVTMS